MIKHDKTTDLLIQIGEKPTNKYWNGNFKGLKVNCNFILKHIRSLIKTGRILEAGCGNGDYLIELDNYGYDSYGVDNVKELVDQINTKKATHQDIRRLSFKEDYFNLTLCLGVIEHKKEQFDILKELSRVTKDYIILTFPSISPFRRIKKALGAYKEYKAGPIHCYLLDNKEVIEKMKILGWRLHKKKRYDAMKGLKPLSAYFYKIRLVRRLLNLTLSLLFGHNLLLIFKKQ